MCMAHLKPLPLPFFQTSITDPDENATRSYQLGMNTLQKKKDPYLSTYDIRRYNESDFHMRKNEHAVDHFVLCQNIIKLSTCGVG